MLEVGLISARIIACSMGWDSGEQHEKACFRGKTFGLSRFQFTSIWYSNWSLLTLTASTPASLMLIENTMFFCFFDLPSFFSIRKSQKGEKEVKTRDKNARNVNVIKSDATKIKNLSGSLID